MGVVATPEESRRCRKDLGHLRLKKLEESSNSDPGGTLFGDLFRNISCGFGDLMVIFLAIAGFPSHQINTFHQENSFVWSWMGELLEPSKWGANAPSYC
jgi:hypothetical protein